MSLTEVIASPAPRHPGRSVGLFALAMLALFALRPSEGWAQAGPIGRWNFDASSGVDSSGHGFDMTVGGPVAFVAGRGGKVAALDGTSAFLQRAFDPAFTPGRRSWTLTAWVAPSAAAPAGTQYIVQWYRCGANPSCGGADAAVYALYVSSTGTPGFIFRDDADDTINLTGSTGITDGTFHFLAATFDSASKRGVLFVDGVKAASDSVPSTAALSDGGFQVPLSIGREYVIGWGVPDRYLKGSVDDVRVYGRALSPAEVTALFTGQTLGIPPQTPTSARLAPVLPNPSRGPTRITFSLAHASRVRLRVLDVLGREVRVLADERRDAGEHRVGWDGSDEYGRAMAGGIYFYRLETWPIAGGAGEVYAVRGTLLR